MGETKQNACKSPGHKIPIRPVAVIEDSPTMNRNQGIPFDTDLALRQLGVEPGDKLLVHSSLRLLGWVKGGADAVIDAVLSAVGETGTVMMPAFTFPPVEIFDPTSSPTTMGAIAEAFLKRPGVIRSIHPTHSVSVWGAHKDRLAAEHETATALGVGSPVHQILAEGGDIILLGVGHWANSAVHVAEAIARVPYLDIPYSDHYAHPLTVRLPGGSFKEFPPKENPGCSINFTAVEQPLKRHGLIAYHRQGTALVQRVSGKGLLDLISKMLLTDPLFLLCSWELCPFCPNVKRLLNHTQYGEA
jgi:aminoglycoside 3-N-acetyltransferase